MAQQQQQPEVKVFRAPSEQERSTATLLSEQEEVEVKATPEELASAFRSTIAGRHGPDAPLLTRALRQKEEERLGLYSSRNRTYEHVRIRIRFADRTQIQSEFKETDTVAAIYRFLKESVTETAQATGVVIYTSPPRTEYKASDPRTLRQLGLIPSAIVHLRWDDPQMNATTSPAPLLPHLQSQAQDLPLPQQQQVSETTPSAPASASASAAPTTSKPMPKWLKNIVKK